MMEVVLIVVAAVLVFLTVDTIKTIKAKNNVPASPIEVVNRETERMGRLEAEVDEKLKEIREIEKQESVSIPRPSPAPAAAESPRDPMNDTRCIQAVTEKAEEIERLGREKGISKR